MIARKQLIHLLLPAALLFVTSLACDQSSDSPYGEIGGTQEETGAIFIEAVANDDEEFAMSFLTNATRSAVSIYCDDGKVIPCFKSGISNDWGQFSVVMYLPKFSQGSALVYDIIWNDDSPPIRVVFEILNENEGWRINSWRGLIPFDRDGLDGLLDGTDKTNLFPPEE